MKLNQENPTDRFGENLLGTAAEGASVLLVNLPSS